ncbi:stage II sporulation protein R [Bacillus sp. 1P06AnD]|uniref:stage II sporulation protein R n=1 Tax=Bacillus sp. 1P06AnD TaxID=3132208 RepID=UPI0039A3E396
MKKTNFAGLYVVMLCLGTILSFYIPKAENAQAAEEAVIIPKEAIRLRILANSDTEKDQDLKRAIRDEVNANITTWVKDLTSIDKARSIIKSHVPDIQNIAKQHVAKAGSNQSVKVEFGKAKFPTKLYGQFLYPAGEYEAIVITLGAGEGANWWCVLFPPLCFLDFSNGTAVSAQAMDEEEKQDEEMSMDEAGGTDEKHVSLEEELEENKGLSKENKDDSKHQTKKEDEAKPPLYTERDEESVKIEKRWFFADLMKDLFE